MIYSDFGAQAEWDSHRSKKVSFGKSGLEVSQICFGTEHINQFLPAYGGQMLVDAAEYYGVFFVDTDMGYGSHAQVAAALRIGGRSRFVISTKTYAKTKEQALYDLDRIFEELEPLYIDIAVLHRVQPGELEQCRPALDQLVYGKKEGLIRCIGVSTHSPEVALTAAFMPEIEVVYVTLNREGARLDSGTLEDMLHALTQLHRNGKGTCVLKILNRGRLLPDLEGALKWVLQYQEYIDVYCIGFSALWELKEDLALINSHLQTDEEAKP